MIVKMCKMVLIGKKPLMPELLNFLQQRGCFQVDHIEEDGLDQFKDQGEFSDEISLIENQLAKINSLLAILGKFPPSCSKGGIKSLDEIQEEIESTKRLISEKEQELSFIQSYEKAIDACLPLLKPMENSSHFRALALITTPRRQSQLLKLKSELEKVIGGKAELEIKIVDENLTVAVLIYWRQEEETVKSIVQASGLNELILPAFLKGLAVDEALRVIKDLLSALPKEIEDLKRRLKEIAEIVGPCLLEKKAELLDELERKKAEKMALASHYLFVIQGWCPEEESHALSDDLKRKFGGQVVIRSTEFKEEDAKKAPVLLRNNPLFSPFQLFLSMFRPPRYDRIDPTPFFAIFFPLFFGLIIGDIGYGAVLLALFLFLFFRSKAGIWRSVGIIGTLCSSWTVIFGFLFGELFGTLGEAIGLHPILFDRMHNLITFLIVAIGIGVFQIILGYVLEIYLSFKNGERKEGIEAIAMICWILGAVTLLLAMAGLVPPGAVSIVQYLGLGFLLGGWLGVIVAIGPIMGMVEPLSVMGNILSYSRLFGVGISSVYLAFAANTIGGLFPNIIFTIILAASCHLIFFILGIISPIIQSMRLHFVEFFSKFKYHDYPGREYRPLKKSLVKGVNA